MRLSCTKAGLACFLAFSIAASPGAATPTTETIVLVRHGEKPDPGLGQLSCRGLNRALALPEVLRHAFGKPDAIFAPDPAVQKRDDGKLYDYVRPLATIEPAAIAFGLPVDTSIGFADVAGLSQALDSPLLANALVVVAWEHNEIVSLSRRLVGGHGGTPAEVPSWDKQDYDGMYVIRIAREGMRVTSRFERRAEGLDGLASACPER